MHDKAELNRGKNSLHDQLKLGLQKLYKEYYSEDKARQLMGGKFVLGEINNSMVLSHFHKIKKLYFEER
jgi:hypothetical protein